MVVVPQSVRLRAFAAGGAADTRTGYFLLQVPRDMSVTEEDVRAATMNLARVLRSFEGIQVEIPIPAAGRTVTDRDHFRRHFHARCLEFVVARADISTQSLQLRDIRRHDPKPPIVICVAETNMPFEKELALIVSESGLGVGRVTAARSAIRDLPFKAGITGRTPEQPFQTPAPLLTSGTTRVGAGPHCPAKARGPNRQIYPAANRIKR